MSETPTTPRLPYCQVCGATPISQEHAVETQRRWLALMNTPDPARSIEPIKSADDLRIHGITDEEADAFLAAMEPTSAEAMDVERLREALYQSLVAMVSISEGPGDNEFARGLKRASLNHAIESARAVLRSSDSDR